MDAAVLADIADCLFFQVSLEKEVRMKASIGPHDLQIKCDKVEEFLDRGNRVKITISFRHFDIQRFERGSALLQSIEKKVDHLVDRDLLEAPAEKKYRLAGRTMQYILHARRKD
jgi:translation initiation factor IF-3